MANNIVKLIVVIALLGGAVYYGYSKWKSLQPPDVPENQVFNPYGPPMMPMMPAPGTAPAQPGK